MAKISRWYVKDLSKLTQVSVRALHHYDQIGLLKPALRAANGYRLYSEKDLSKLQQIVALKFCGFDLAQIKTLLAKVDAPVHKHLSAQVEFLKEKAKALTKASQMLESIIADCKHDESVICNWENIVKFLGVYNIMNELEKTSFGKLLTPEQLKKMAVHQEKIKNLTNNNSPAVVDEATMIDEAKNCMHEDPTGNVGQAFIKRWMLLLDAEAQCMDQEVQTILMDTLGKLPPTQISTETAKVHAWIGKALDHAAAKPLTPEALSAIKTQVQNISEEMLQQYFDDLQPAFDELKAHLSYDPYSTAGQQAIQRWMTTSSKYTDISALLLKAHSHGLYTPPKTSGWFSMAHNLDLVKWMQKAIHFRLTGNKI